MTRPPPLFSVLSVRRTSLSHVSAVSAYAGRGRRLASAAGVFGVDLPKPLWVVQSGIALNAFGTGLVMPFVIIWLHDVRGVSLAEAGASLAAFGALSLAVTPLSGILLDALGGRRVLACGCAALAIAYGVLPVCATAWQAALALALAGLGNGAFHPACSEVLVALTPADRRHTSFALSRAGGNLGLGLGAGIGGLIASTQAPGSFDVLFLGDAATFALFGAIVLGTRLPTRHAPTRAEQAEGWSAVFRDRPFLAFVAFNAVVAAAGYAQLEAALPVFARHHAGLSDSLVGLIFVANVAAVVVLQMPISRLVEGRRRMRALALCTVTWAIAWLLAAGSGIVSGVVAPVVLVLVAAAVVGSAECVHGAVSGALTADLASPGLRGRYLSLSVGAWGLGFAVGPALSGVLLGSAPLALWFLLAGVCLAAGGSVLVLEKHVPEHARITPRRQAES